MRKDKNTYKKVNIATLIDKKPGIRYRSIAEVVKRSAPLTAIAISVFILAYSIALISADITEDVSPKRVELKGTVINAAAETDTTYSKLGFAEDDNNHGYIISAKTMPSTTDELEQQYIEITGSLVNVFSGAASSYKKLGTVTCGSVYEYLGSDKSYNGIVWHKIQYTSDQVGWVASAYSNIVNISTEELRTSAQDAVDTAAKKYGAVGVQVAVIRNGKVTDKYNYGYATKGDAVMEDDSKIRIASISKVVVGMSAMKMQDEGIVELDEDIGTYWNATPYKKTTLRNLLTHTSYFRDNSYANSRAGVVNQLQSSAYYRTSNAWMYNNYAIGLAGSTLEVASGQTLNSYADEKFFSPLGIDAAFSSGDLEDTSKLAALYYPGDSVARSAASAKNFKAKEIGGNTAYFAGGLTISAEDMAKLIAILANDGVYNGTRYLSKESVETMETQYCDAYARGHSFKQCIPLRHQTDIYGQSEMYYHLGTAYGTLAYAGYNPDTKNGVVVITTGASDSYDSYGIFSICADIAEYFFNE